MSLPTHYLPERVLAICPHPDDMEWNAGGTFYLWIQTGAEVRVVITTRAADPARRKTHEDEELAATSILGYEVAFLDEASVYSSQPPSSDQCLSLCRLIRELKPEIVMAMPPFDQNTDHGGWGAATLRAVLMARCPFEGAANSERLLDPSDPGAREVLDGTAPHRVRELWVVPGCPTQNLAKMQPNHYLDVTDVFELKLAALRAHVTKNPDDLLVDLAIYCGMQDGRKIGVQYAESFLRIPIGTRAELGLEYKEWRAERKRQLAR